MSASAQSHARSHALLLLQKLLNLRDGASPLTLVLDSLEQSGGPVVREFMNRAKVSKSKIVYVSFATIRRPRDVDVFVRARGKPPASLLAEITSHYAPGGPQKTLLIIDVLNPLLSAPAFSSPHLHLPTFLSALVAGPAVSLVATYHLDVPLSPSSPHSYPDRMSEYEPHPLATLTHLATAVLRVSSLRREADRRYARDRSLPEPGWGVGEGREGVLLGFRRVPWDDGGGGGGGEGKGGAGQIDEGGLILDMELRRRSGRAISERFVLVPSVSASPSSTRIFLLEEHPLFRTAPETTGDANGEAGARGGEGDGETPTSTFNLGLTEKQRRDREGVVLPYFDAQNDVGSAGEGGRILYEMGREDDFDEEEDEI